MQFLDWGERQSRDSRDSDTDKSVLLQHSCGRVAQWQVAKPLGPLTRAPQRLSDELDQRKARQAVHACVQHVWRMGLLEAHKLLDSQDVLEHLHPDQHRWSRVGGRCHGCGPQTAYPVPDTLQHSCELAASLQSRGAGRVALHISASQFCRHSQAPCSSGVNTGVPQPHCARPACPPPPCTPQVLSALLLAATCLAGAGTPDTVAQWQARTG